MKNAHDLIMEANRDILTKRSVKVKSGSAEDAIVKINEGEFVTYVVFIIKGSLHAYLLTR